MNSTRIFLVVAIAVGVLISYALSGHGRRESETAASAVVSNTTTSRPGPHQMERDNDQSDRHNVALENELSLLTKSLRNVQNDLYRFKQSLTQEIDSLKQSMSTFDATPDSELVSSENRIADDDTSEHEREIRANSWYENQVSQIEAVLTAERTDQQWTHQTEERFASVMDWQDNGGIQLRNVSCGDSVCRVEAGFAPEDSNTGPNIDHLIYGDIEWDGQMLSKVNADTGEVTIYLIRPGMTIPDLGSEG